ncbi:MAG: FG-GAP repeat protein [Methylococcales bacterium]
MPYNKKRRRRFSVLICLLCINAFAYAKLPVSAGLNQPIKAGEIPDGLSASDWISIQSQMNAGRYKAYPDGNGGYHSSNPAHGWQIDYAEDGTTTLSPRGRDTASYHLGLKLNAVGYETLERLKRPQQISSQDNTLDYHWNDALTERWVNSKTDLEQWFILNQRPEGSANGQLLTLQLTVDTDLTAIQQGNNIRFVHATGTTITYDKLKVWDANGRNLSAQMQLTEQQLSLVVDDSTARYPLIIDPSFEQQAYLKTPNEKGGDLYGFSVAIAGDTLVVGAPLENIKITDVDGEQSDKTTENAGAVYVFTRSGSTWSQQAYLTVSNADGGDVLGGSVAIEGNTLVVGAKGESSKATGVDGDQSDNSAEDSGAVYVFTRNGNTWTQQAYLKASNTNGGDFFGDFIAITGDTVVVGASFEASVSTGVGGDQSDNSAEGSGAAYVFTRNDSTWSQQAYLKASNADAGDRFGQTVAIAGDTVVVAATYEASKATEVNGDQNDNSLILTGAAYVFTRNGNTWSQQAYLKASNTGEGDQFGSSVAIAGETVVVGARAEDSIAREVDGDQSNNSAGSAGAAYVFIRNGSTWNQQAYLKSSKARSLDRFGESVAIAGDTVVIGGVGRNNHSGEVYVFTRSGNIWSEQGFLESSFIGHGEGFGRAVAIAGDTLVVGSPFEQFDSGSAYVFRIIRSASNQPIPTLSEWAIILLSLMLGLLVWVKPSFVDWRC